MKRHSLGYQLISTRDGGGVRVPGMIELPQGDYLEIGPAFIMGHERTGAIVQVMFVFETEEQAAKFLGES